MNGRGLAVRSALVIVFSLLTLVGCQEIFTYTPLAFLRRDPSTLSPAQKVEAAKEALQSGDPSAMKAAYDAIKSDTSPDATYQAAQLGVELSGVGTLLTQVATGQLSLSGNAIGDFVAATAGIDTSYLKDAGTRLSTLNTQSYPLTTNDRMMGAVGLVLQAAGPSTNLTSLTASDVAPAVNLLAPISTTDPYANLLSSYLSGL
ncbi:MAG TPA: hypothetical protein VFH83_00830 [Spirochaetia bacterium]|nr:hypothetical protein [Spirochaetia bacterium]